MPAKLKFAAHIINKNLGNAYLLQDGRVVFGQSETHMRYCLSEAKVRGSSRTAELAESIGFKVARGRGQRITRKGYAWGVPCVVITRGHQVPCYIDTAAYGWTHDVMYGEPEPCFTINEL